MNNQLQELIDDIRAASLKQLESIEEKISRIEREAELKLPANEGNKFY